MCSTFRNFVPEMIDRATIDKIMDATNIVDVVGEFVTLRKAGVNYKGLSVLRCGENKKSDYLMTYLRNNLYFCRAKVCHNKILGQSQ